LPGGNSGGDWGTGNQPAYPSFFSDLNNSKIGNKQEEKALFYGVGGGSKFAAHRKNKTKVGKLV